MRAEIIIYAEKGIDFSITWEVSVISYMIFLTHVNWLPTVKNVGFFLQNAGLESSYPDATINISYGDSCENNTVSVEGTSHLFVISDTSFYVMRTVVFCVTFEVEDQECLSQTDTNRICKFTF